MRRAPSLRRPPAAVLPLAAAVVLPLALLGGSAPVTRTGADHRPPATAAAAPSPASRAVPDPGAATGRRAATTAAPATLARVTASTPVAVTTAAWPVTPPSLPVPPVPSVPPVPPVPPVSQRLPALAGPVVLAPAATRPAPAPTQAPTQASTPTPAPTIPARPSPLVPAAPVEQVCAPATPGHATCFAQRLAVAAITPPPPLRIVDRGQLGIGLPGSPIAVPAPPSAPPYGPGAIQSAYGLTGLTAVGRTVAVVDAYGYPNAERDLGIYRSHFGLPACTRANGCLTIMSQTGSTTALPATDNGWSQEQALDLDAVSAACPSCRILLVQASSTSFGDLGAAVNQAAAQPGVVAISNSYGSDSDLPDSTYGAAWHHPGIAVTASTGDGGFLGASFPASSQWVVAVGGTTLSPATSSARGWSETAWDGAGSGCSIYNAPPLGQLSSFTGCLGRAMADVAAVADPTTGLAVYAPDDYGVSGWSEYGGTSLASPLVAAAYALSGNTAGNANTIPYAHPGAFNDVTSGSNGACTTSLWCVAGLGWDGPTGLGSPRGVAGL